MTDVAIPAPGVRLRGLRRAEFEAMVQAGLFVDEKIELLGGELVEMSPQGAHHTWDIEELNSQLAPLMARGYAVRVQLPLAIDDVSLPEPDVAVADRGTRDHHTSSAHAVIEVSCTSQRYDLDLKGPRYAAAGIPLYIVLDLPARRAIVHRDASGDGYQTVTELGPDGELDVLGQPLDLSRLLQDPVEDA